MDHLYIRHTVGGRLFLDSKKHEVSFAITPASDSEGWRLTIDLADSAIAEDICRHNDELNIFVIENGAVDKKTWYYSTHGLVDYNNSDATLTIHADGKIDYNV